MKISTLAIAGALLLGACATAQQSTESTPDPVKALAPVSSLPSYVKFPDRQYVLRDTVAYRLHDPDVTITIPAGFVTDFASIPKVFRSLFTDNDVHDLPGLLHDYLYWRQSCGRSEADKLFLVALDEVGVGYFERYMMYAGVQAGGSGAWKNNRQARVDNLPRIIPGNFMKIPVGTTWSGYRSHLRDSKVPLDPPDAVLPPYCSS